LLVTTLPCVAAGLALKRALELPGVRGVLELADESVERLRARVGAAAPLDIGGAGG
jgi:hypothetical protein